MKKDRIAVTDKLNIKDERNIMSTNFISSDRTSDVARFAVAPGPGHRLLKCKTMLWLALPITLAAGCASGPSRPVASTEAQAPAVTLLSERQAANVVVGREIFDMMMADRNINYSLSASLNNGVVNNGVVTLGGTSSSKVERQRIVDRMWELAGVTQVKDELGRDLAPTTAQPTVVVR